jgi:hypothetical protein
MDGGRMVYFGPFSMSAINRFLPSPANSLLEDAAKEAGSDSISEKASRKSSSIQRQSTLSSARLESMQGIVIPGEERSASVGFRLEMFKSMRVFWVFGGLFIGILSFGERDSLFLFDVTLVYFVIPENEISQAPMQSLFLFPMVPSRLTC